ncbi:MULTISPECIES: cytochrome C oxidase subunit II [Salimicrobium]|uniref:Cytochrome C oxidase subunit II n=1 Tax=Salimicrobium humidisoli TaxID=2029857 RepID=A0ABX4HW83_9BACI|nr:MULTISPECIES: cytochrome C oxidase subunit II [Salimicrobium]PBB07082.1 cytochrome C oxidase subunit II [Salimicrobium humidisoli]
MKKESSLKGTLISVFVVGFIIVAMWIGVYTLYIGRL